YVNAMAFVHLQEKADFTRLSRLLVDKGTEALRNTLDAIHPPANLPAVLNGNKKSLLRLKFKVVNGHQWDLLFPPSGNPPDSKTFDVTLLMVLLRNICGLPPPATGWNTMPPDTDRSPQANITRIKLFRNEVYAHVASTQVDKATFENLWQKISEALVDLNIPQKEIDDLKTCPIGAEEEIYVRSLKEWFLKEEDFKNMLIDLTTKVKLVEKQLTQSNLQQENDSDTFTTSMQHLTQITKENRQGIQQLCQFSSMQNKIERPTCDSKEDKGNEKLLQTLAKNNFKSKIRSKVKLFHPGTRDWLLKKVKNWFTTEEESSLLLITGGPGFGKSVFAAKVCEIFRENGNLAACHFCDFSNSNLKDPMMMMQSLASQMCENVPGFKEKLLDQLKRPHKVNSLKDAFQIYFQNPLDELEVEPRLIVIDGLDESATDDKSDMQAGDFRKYLKKSTIITRMLKFFPRLLQTLDCRETIKVIEKVNEARMAINITICEQIFEAIRRNVSSGNELKLTKDVKHALDYGYKYLLACKKKDSFSWLVDMVIVHVYCKVLRSDLVISRHLRQRISLNLTEICDKLSLIIPRKVRKACWRVIHIQPGTTTFHVAHLLQMILLFSAIADRKTAYDRSYCVWSSNERCDRCFREEQVFTGIYHGVHCNFYWYNQSLHVIEDTHFTTLEAWQIFAAFVEDRVPRKGDQSCLSQAMLKRRQLLVFGQTVDENLKIKTTQRQLVPLCPVANEFLRFPGMVDFSRIAVSAGASFVLGTDNRSFFLWKKSEGLPARYELHICDRFSQFIQQHCVVIDINTSIITSKIDLENVPEAFCLDARVFCTNRVVIRVIPNLIQIYDLESFKGLRSSFQRNLTKDLVIRSKLSPKGNILAVPRLTGDMDFFQLCNPQSSSVSIG
ncbi:Hypothetical predicted protein, partial [Paramuricea clavata]